MIGIPAALMYSNFGRISASSSLAKVIFPAAVSFNPAAR